MANISINFGYTITPPPGLTPVTQKLHQFQTRSVDRLRVVATQALQESVLKLQTRWRSVYSAPRSPGHSSIANSIRYQVQASRTGVSGSVQIANTRYLRFLTSAVAGGQPRLWSLGFQGYDITPVNREYLRFYWARHGKWVRVAMVKHPGFEKDLIADVAREQGIKFREAAVQSMSFGVLELTAGGDATRRHIRRR